MVVLPTADYSEEEREKILQYIISLKATQIRAFLEKHEIPKSGNKTKLQERILEHLENGELCYTDLVDFLDTVAPWGKQHVFLYDGPEGEIENWRNREWVSKHLNCHGVDTFLNNRLPLILPQELALSSIEHTEKMLRVFTVMRRDHWEHEPEKNYKIVTAEGNEIEFRAYVHHVYRGIVIFEWNLISNIAMLQITQLPRKLKYENVERQFADLVKSWLDLNLFVKLDIKPVISKLQETEEGSLEVRYHKIDLKTLQGRLFSVKSSTPKDSIRGEKVIDDALRNVRQQAVGNLGNFYWLPATENPSNGNPLQNEIHTVIVGYHGRINFRTPNREEDIRYVLSRVRELSR